MQQDNTPTSQPEGEGPPFAVATFHPYQFEKPRSREMVHEWSKRVLELFGARFLQDNHQEIFNILKETLDNRTSCEVAMKAACERVEDLHWRLQQFAITTKIADTVFTSAVSNLRKEWKISKALGLSPSSKGYLELADNYEIQPLFGDTGTFPEWMTPFITEQTRKVVYEVGEVVIETGKKDPTATTIRITEGQWNQMDNLIKVYGLAIDLIQVSVDSAISLCGHSVTFKVHQVKRST